MSIDHEQRRLQALVTRLDARLHTTQVIAEIILDNSALRDGIPRTAVRSRKAIRTEATDRPLKPLSPLS